MRRALWVALTAVAVMAAAIVAVFFFAPVISDSWVLTTPHGPIWFYTAEVSPAYYYLKCGEVENPQYKVNSFYSPEYPLVAGWWCPRQPTIGPSVYLSQTSGGPDTIVVLTGINLEGGGAVNVTAKFGATPLSLSGDCGTNISGGLANCSFVVPNLAPGSYTVTVFDGANSPEATFTIPQ